MALILRRYGAWNAINLDGGGSTAMAVGGLTVSSPQGGGAERPVADMLLVYSDRAYQPDAPALPAVTADAEAAQEEPAARLVVPTVPLVVGRAIPLKIQDGARLVSGASPAIIWQGPAAGGVGFVNQKGYFITTAPGKGTLAALYGGHLLTASVTVIGATPAPTTYTLQARLAADTDGIADRSQLIVRIADSHGKPLAHASLTLAVTGGTADKDILQTDFDGSATVGITWTADKGGSVRVSSGALTPVTLTRP